MKVEKLSEKNLRSALGFYGRNLNDEFFTHFLHTNPKDMLADKWLIYVLINNNDRIVSWSQAEFFPNNPRKLHVCRLGFITDYKHRGQGYSSKLMDFILEAIPPEIKKLSATTRADNLIMRDMFLKRGFEIEGIFRDEEYIHRSYVDILSLAKFL